MSDNVTQDQITDQNDHTEESVEHVESLATADQPNYTLPIRFQALKVSSAKQPPFRAYLQVDGVLGGVAIPMAIFQDEETKGFAVSLPGTRYQRMLIPMPTVVRTIKHTAEGDVFGELLDHDAPNDDGVWKVKKLPEAIMDAFNRYRATGVADQFVTLQPA